MKILRFLMMLSTFFTAANYFPANGASVFSEDFDDYPKNAYLESNPKNPHWRWASNDSADRNTRIYGDNRHYFGDSKKYAALLKRSQDNAGSYVFATQAFKPLTAGEVSIIFYEPSLIPAEGDGFWMRLAGGEDNFIENTDTTAFGVFFKNGMLREAVPGKNGKASTMGSNEIRYDVDKMNTLTLVFNNKSTSLTYDRGIVSPGKMDIWLNDEKIATWESSGGLHRNGEIKYIWFGATMGSSGELYLGKVTVNDF